MTIKKLYMDLHAIQSMPPSNLNRDDVGTPKTSVYGGVVRSRVSSQAWKRAMRDHFVANGLLNDLGIRTLEYVRLLAVKIKGLDDTLTHEEAEKKAEEVFILSISKKNVGKALLYIGDKQLDLLAKFVVDGGSVIEGKTAKLKEKRRDEVKIDIDGILSQNIAPDIHLFGRMVAENTELNVESASQVAHIISTHPVKIEYDYFTAMDDAQSKGHSGAAHLGTREFTSATYYRYANVNLHELRGKLSEDDFVNTMTAFIDAYIKALPSGMQNSYANATLPSTVVVNLRKDRPASAVTAFENPVKENGDGYTETSILALKDELRKIDTYLDEPVVSFVVDLEGVFKGVQGYTDVSRLSELKDGVRQAVANYFKD